MATASLIITTKDRAGKKLQKTITNINPDASNDKFATLGQMLNSLTDDTYVETTRIDKTNCDLDASKRTPTLTLSTYTYSLEDAGKGGTGAYGKLADVTYDGDGELHFYCLSDPCGTGAGNGDSKTASFFVYYSPTRKEIGHLLWKPEKSAEWNGPVSFVLEATETETCKGVSVTFSIE